MPLRPSHRLMLTAGTINAAAVWHASLYGLVTVGSGAPVPLPGHWIYGWAVGSLLGTFALATPWMTWRLRGLDRVVGALREGREPASAERDHAAREALRAPVAISRLSTYLWFFAALVLPLGAHVFEPGIEPLALLHSLIVQLMIASVSAIFIYYFVESYARRVLIPRLVPDGKLSRFGVPRVSIVFKLVVLLISTILIPVALLSVGAIYGIANAGVLSFLGLSYFSFGLWQCWFIVRSVHRPVDDLAREVERVARGDLDAHATVVSLDRIGDLGEGFNDMVEKLRQAAFVKDTFGRYVSPEIVSEVAAGKVSLGGELRSATVLFSDIRGFTAMSERLPPAEVVRVLNRYLDRMVELVVRHGGHVDKFIGDAVMATFGVPIARAPGEHALAAVSCALDMLDAVRELNADRGDSPALEIGIGIHTGELIAGNIGSSRKLEYTVIGDTVNTASRIEGLNKTLDTHLLVSAETMALVASTVDARALTPIEVKGKSEPLKIFEVRGRRTESRAASP